MGQFNSPELLETLEITEMTENFIKVTKHLTELKETLTNYVWEKPHFKKKKNKKIRRRIIKFSVDSGFLNVVYGKK